MQVVRTLRRRGWLRGRRLGCGLLVLLLVAVLAGVVFNRATDAVSGALGLEPEPVGGNPLDTPTPAPDRGSGSPVIDRVTDRGRLIVAVQQVPGLAEREPGGTTYTGFDIALVDLVAEELSLDPADTSYKPLVDGEGMLERGEADLVVGGYQMTPERAAVIGFAGPYLETPQRLAVAADSAATGLDSIGGGSVCAERDSPAATTLAPRLGERLITRTALGACANLLGRDVAALAGDQPALEALVAEDPDELRLAREPIGGTAFGIGLAPGDDVLRQRVSGVLQTAIDDGTWARLYAEHLGSPAPDPPQLDR